MKKSPPEWDLTIITVCRNVKDSIPKTVQSVLAQKKKASISIEHGKVLFFLNSNDSLIEEPDRRQKQGRLFSSVVESTSATEATYSPHLYV